MKKQKASANEIRDFTVKLLTLIPRPDEEYFDVTSFNAKYSSELSYLSELVILLLDKYLALQRNPKDKSQIRATTQEAYYFIQSYSNFVKDDINFIVGWEDNQDSNIYDGIDLLRDMETQRVQKQRNPHPLRKMEIILLLIKANIKDSTEPAFLFQYNKKTSRYQLIGGNKKPEDITNEEAAKRLIKKELNVKHEEKLKFKELDPKITSRTISGKAGVYTEYKINLISVDMTESVLETAEIDRWLNLAEIKSGLTSEGISIQSPLQDLQSNEKTNLENMLEKLPLSTKVVFEDMHRKNTKVETEESHLVTKILKSEESSTLEFKSSARWDYKLNNLNKGLEKIVVKSISGFLNSGDGILVIGLDDKKTPLGIANDINTLQRKDEDGYMQYLVTLISTSIGTEFISFIHISFEKVENKTICIVQIKKSKVPVFVKEGESRLFFVRAGNTTRQLNAEEAYKYIQINW